MDTDREAAEAILRDASDDARKVLAAVLKIERSQISLRRPVAAQIEREIVDEIKRTVK